MRCFRYSLSLIILLGACVPVPTDDQEKVAIDITDKEIQKIYSLQNSQSADSLRIYFSSKNATYRYLAAMAFASFQESTIIPELSSLLFDKNQDVKSAAAYALGQIGGENVVKGLLEAFDNDVNRQNSKFNANILEAVGKSGDKELLDYMATTTTYKLEDDLLILGQARGIYRFALRGITSPKGTTRMAEIVINSAFSQDSRVVAANYFYRARRISIEDYQFQLYQTLLEEDDPRIRMALGHRLAQSNQTDLSDNMINYLKSESDPRVVINILRGLSHSQRSDIVEVVLPFVKNDNLGIAKTAISIVSNTANRSHTAMLRSLADSITNKSLKAQIMKSALSSAPWSYRNTKRLISNNIQQELASEISPYDRVQFIDALSGDPSNYKLILSLAQEEPFEVRSLIIPSLSNIIESPNFKNIYRTRQMQDAVKEEMVDFLIDQIDSGDSGVISASGEWLSASASKIKGIFDDSLSIATTIKLLNTPSDIESKISLSRALAALTNYTYEEERPQSAKELDWETLENISESAIAIIVTTKGKIRVRLTPYITPATVANFIELTDDNYFDGKNVHRVVPNFVIQGGCPRGDGYGSADYTIRSEFPQSYFDTLGYIGMASAGRHTESVQWFITQSPTPHLDGKYTNFGTVIDGMDVVNKIEVGDIIQDIRILKYN